MNLNKQYPLAVSASDPDGDQLVIRWELLPEATDLGQGGDREDRPQPITGLVTNSASANAILTAPDKTGAYRLFVYITDGNQHVATANIPFFC